MSDDYKDMTTKITSALDAVAPKGTKFVVLFVLPNDNSFEIVSNISDTSAIALMEDAIECVSQTEASSVDDDQPVDSN